WAGELNLSYPMLSDFMRTTAEKYGVLNKERGIAGRATFVIDANGVIQHIEEGRTAVDPNGALAACGRVGH
ncbi:MAG: redoxin domain-containing protein, partial [bacterium]|nr:redoxin domain-containing protein [bacterium]